MNLDGRTLREGNEAGVLKLELAVFNVIQLEGAVNRGFDDRRVQGRGDECGNVHVAVVRCFDNLA
jgi:hypothetical protein